MVQLSLPQIRHDYITLHRQCTSLLGLIRKEFKKKLGIKFQIDGDANKITCLDLGIDLVRLVTGGEAKKLSRSEQRKGRIDTADREKIGALVDETIESFITKHVAGSQKPAQAFSEEHITSFEGGCAFIGRGDSLPKVKET